MGQERYGNGPGDSERTAPDEQDFREQERSAQDGQTGSASPSPSGQDDERERAARPDQEQLHEEQRSEADDSHDNWG
ncbi:hypothetical protein G6045_32345 [Streptomyces sp. YC504]|uniref:Uncharacterized protein n=1 Tax=Streptomyces mesophilus TaxID=1775132 RepID=A0A6G4XUM7_9ACTN|nr:hypothetical protein [Streptomyces mesophilus]NGO80311.1 hypothetical protein [Streptomyces mesophilus]